MNTRRADELERGDVILLDIATGKHKGTNAMKVQQSMEFGNTIFLDLKFPDDELFFMSRRVDSELELLMPEQDPDTPDEVEEHTS